MKKPLSKFTHKLKAILEETWLIIKAIIGITIIISTIALCSIYINPKLLAILCTSVGTLTGSIILLSAFNQLKKKQKEQDFSDNIDKTALQRQLHESEQEKLNIRLQKERLERMQIDVTAVSPILKLGLVSIDAKLHDFDRRFYKDDNTKEGWWLWEKDVNYRDEYVGALVKKFKAQLGVDLNKLRVQKSGESIIVSGIKTEFQGLKDESTEWILREIRTRKKVNGEIQYHHVINDDARIQDSMIKQEARFKERINLGADFKNLDYVINEMAKQFIRLILKPLGKKVEFVSALKEGLTLNGFILEENRKLQYRIKQLDHKVCELESSYAIPTNKIPSEAISIQV